MKKVLVTPEMAREWLENQAANRKPSRGVIENYIKTMRDGRWVADPALPLWFGEDGRLIDGQHRLHAVVAHGEPVDFYVARTTREIMDLASTSKARTLAERLMMTHGFPNGESKAIAALGTLLCDRMEGPIRVNAKRQGHGNKKRRTDEVFAAFAWAGASPRDIILEARGIYEMQPARFRLLTPAIIGFCLAQQAPGVTEFLHECCMDEHPSRRTSVLSLRRQLGNYDYGTTVKMAMIARAYNDDSMRNFKMTTFVHDLRGGIFDGRDADASDMD